MRTFASILSGVDWQTRFTDRSVRSQVTVNFGPISPVTEMVPLCTKDDQNELEELRAAMGTNIPVLSEQALNEDIRRNEYMIGLEMPRRLKGREQPAR